jgi:hypothetical protein
MLGNSVRVSRHCPIKAIVVRAALAAPGLCTYGHRGGMPLGVAGAVGLRRACNLALAGRGVGGRAETQGRMGAGMGSLPRLRH